MLRVRTEPCYTFLVSRLALRKRGTMASVQSGFALDELDPRRSVYGAAVARERWVAVLDAFEAYRDALEDALRVPTSLESVGRVWDVEAARRHQDGDADQSDEAMHSAINGVVCELNQLIRAHAKRAASR